MMNYGNENLEFERINRKLDTLYEMVKDLTRIIEIEQTENEIKRAENELQNRQFDLEIKKDGRRTREEMWSYRNKNWWDIDRLINERKNANENCMCEVSERY